MVLYPIAAPKVYICIMYFPTEQNLAAKWLYSVHDKEISIFPLWHSVTARPAPWIIEQTQRRQQSVSQSGDLSTFFRFQLLHLPLKQKVPLL